MFLEEPWLTESISGGCRDALSRTYVAGGPAWPARTTSHRAVLALGLDATHYAEMAEAIVKAIEANQPYARVVDTFGISQGAQRTSWFWQADAPRVGGDRQPVSRATQTSVEFIERCSEAVLDSWMGHCPECVDATAVDAFAAVSESRWAVASMTVEGRSAIGVLGGSAPDVAPINSRLRRRTIAAEAAS